MTRTLPRNPVRTAETALTLVSAALIMGTWAGCAGSGEKPAVKPVEQIGPVIDAGPQFAIAATRLDVKILTLRDGESVPGSALAMVKAQGQSLPEPIRNAFAVHGFLAAFMNDDQLAELERILTTAPPALPPPPPTVIPKPSTADGTGASIIGGAAPAPEPRPEAVVAPAPKGPPVSNLASVTIRPAATWTPLVDAPTRNEPWALAVGQGVVSLKPGTLRWFIRSWPAPAEPVPTAGMAGELRLQLLPVVTGPLYEPTPDPLAPPPLSTDLAARGQVLSRQAIAASLRGGAALVLMALPEREERTSPGPAAESPPMLGQALLGAGPPPTPGARTSGQRVLVLRPFVPGTYRLLLDRAAPADADR